MIYRCRVILDAKEDVFRDIEINQDVLLEDFHNVIVQSFGFEGAEMASFYTTDDTWQQLEEISLFDTSDDYQEKGEKPFDMSSVTLSEIFNKDNPKLLYVYDFLNLWTFFIELVEFVEPMATTSYPALIYSHGVIEDYDFNPNAQPDITFDQHAFDSQDLGQEEEDLFLSSSNDILNIDSLEGNDIDELY